MESIAWSRDNAHELEARNVPMNGTHWIGPDDREARWDPRSAHGISWPKCHRVPIVAGHDGYSTVGWQQGNGCPFFKIG